MSITWDKNSGVCVYCWGKRGRSLDKKGAEPTLDKNFLKRIFEFLPPTNAHYISIYIYSVYLTGKTVKIMMGAWLMKRGRGLGEAI